MYEAITIDRSIFSVNQSYVDAFNRLADQLQPYYTLNLSGAISNRDVWTAVFNIWLMSLPDEMIVLESVEKTFYYSSNFIIYEHLKNDFSFINFPTRLERSNELSFILSIHLTNKLNKYLFDLMINNDLEDIIEKNRKRNYFDAHNESDNKIMNFIHNHERFLKVLVHDITLNNTISRIVKKCCDNALKDCEQFKKRANFTLPI